MLLTDDLMLTDESDDEHVSLVIIVKTSTLNGVVWEGVWIVVSLKLPCWSSMSQQLFCRELRVLNYLKGLHNVLGLNQLGNSTILAKHTLAE